MSTLDLDHAYRPVRRLTVVPVADEAAVYDRRTNRLHRLDPIATVVWSRLDGVTSVRGLSAELAEAYSATVEQVTHDVAALLTDLVDQELVEPAGGDGGGTDDRDEEDGEDAEPPPAPGELRVLRVAPSICVDTVNGLGWHATDALAVDGLVVGVRTSDDATRAAVHAALPGARWLEGLEADANVSLRPPVTGDGVSELGQVYGECTLVGRGRDLHVLLDRVRAEIAGRVIRDRDDLLACRVSVLRSPDGVVLTPAAWWPKLVGYDRALTDAGWELLGRQVVLTTSGAATTIRLTRLSDDGTTVTFEECGPVVRVIGPFAPDPGAPAERLAAVAGVLSRGSLEARSAAVLEVCADVSDEVDLVAIDDPDAFLRWVRG